MQVFQLVVQAEHFVRPDESVCRAAPDVDHDRRTSPVTPGSGVRVERVHAYAAGGHGHQDGHVDQLMVPERLEQHLDAVQVDAVARPLRAFPQHHVPRVIAGRQTAQHRVVIGRPAVPVLRFARGLQVHDEPVGQPRVRGRRRLHQQPGVAHVDQQPLAQLADAHLVREHHHRSSAQVLVDNLVDGPGQTDEPDPVSLVV